MKDIRNKTRHLIIKWNPSRKFHRDAPKTIEKHCEILKRVYISSDDPYVYWGRISKTATTVFSNTTLEHTNKLITSHKQEAHLYLYCPDDKISKLHVGHLTLVTTRDARGDDRTPDYYSEITYSIPYWFKLKDIKKIPLSELENLLDVNGEDFDPVSSNIYPMIVSEREEKLFFDICNNFLSELEEYIMRCFKTGTKCSRDVIFDSKGIFIGLPYQKKYLNFYEHAIKPILEQNSYNPWIGKDVFQNIDLMCKICEGIQSSKKAIIDISGWNANVLFELGLLYGLSRHVILIKEDKEDVPVDLKGLEYISYDRDDYDDFQEKLNRYL